MKTFYKIAVFLLLFLAVGCYGKQSSIQSIDLNSVDLQVAGLSPGQSKEIDIGVPYEYALVIPPYTTDESLAKTGISKEVIRLIRKISSNNENWYIFLVFDNQVEGYVILDAKYSTSGFLENKAKVIRVDHPNKLRIRKQPRELRPYEFF